MAFDGEFDFEVILSYKCNTGINRRTEVYRISAKTERDAIRIAKLNLTSYEGTCGLVWFIRDIDVESVRRV